MGRQAYRTLDDQDIEDLGVFEYLDDETPHFVPAPPPPPVRVVYDAPLLARLKLELPMLWAWIMVSCFFPAPWAWIGWGTGLIAFNCWMRPAYAQRRLTWLFKIYCAAGIGQILAGLTRVFNFTALQPLLGFYALAVLLAWIVLELRYQTHLPPDSIPQSADDQVYYFYG